MRLSVPGASPPAEVNKYLLPHEQQVITVRRHPAILIGPIAVFVAGLIAATVLSATVLQNHPVPMAVAWILVGVLLLRLLWKTGDWAVEYFVVTSARMILTSGLVTRKVAMMPLNKVTDMSFQRTFLGRLLGYGEFILESAGQDQALRTVDHVPYPEQLYLEVCGLLFKDDSGDD
ncbi:MAG TPA: PH domain-containing protein [Streptosporangiaceae bacterium]|nr:PH domain-containing protein [Streptosporangiaceae bacterium]